MNVLIAGGGIAGLAAALFLHRKGHRVQVVERAPSFQKRGYAISLKSFGVRLMTELGLERPLRTHAMSFDKLRICRTDGEPLQVLSDEAVTEVTHGHVFLYRSELHAVLHEAATAEVGPARYGLAITTIAQDEGGARVTLSDGTVERCDLVVVAEGMRSTTRRLLWGDEGQRPFGVIYAAGTVDVAHGLDPRAVHGYFGEGHNLAFIPQGAERLLIQAYWRDPQPERPDPAKARAALVEGFRSFGPGIRRVLDAIPPDGDVFCDAVSMIVLPSRVKGRVVLLGDAGYCPTFLSGMGASLGLLGAKVLGVCLPPDGAGLPEALARYDATLRPIVEHFQATAVANVGTALPSTHLKSVFLEWATHLTPVPLLTRHLRQRFAVEDRLLAGLV